MRQAPGTQYPALDTFRIGQGEFPAILGESGSKQEIGSCIDEMPTAAHRS
ncbi:hypothetical protein ACWEKM_28510 [Streptomyces sp. NPDC004752]